MRLSQTGLGTIRVNNLDKSYPAQDILLQTNQLVQYGTGIYAYNNVPLKLRENVESVIKGVLDKYGCIEILLPTLQPAKLWEESGRLSKYIEEGVMLSVKTDKGDFVMAPTAEEAKRQNKFIHKLASYTISNWRKIQKRNSYKRIFIKRENIPNDGCIQL